MNDLFIYSLITSIFIGGVAGYLGSLMLTRRMALVAGPLGHLALPGVALALIYGLDVSLMAFPFVVLGILLIWLFEMRTKLPMEALTAIVFAGGVAAAFLFLPIEEAEIALVGDVSMVGFYEMIFSVIISIALFFIVYIIYPGMMLINISEDLARSEGVNVKKYNFLYLLGVAVIVALGVKAVGSLMTAALVAIPAATARNFCVHMRTYAITAVFSGIASAVSGLFLSRITDFSVGPLIILSSAGIFLISLIFKKSYVG